MTIATTIRMRPLVPPLSRRADWALVLAASLFIGLMAQVSVPLPFTPVPITGQTFAVLLVGAALGARRGSLAVLTYLVEGLAGMPVFAGGTGGLAHLLGPTGGYLLGFVAAAWAVGRLAERGLDRRLRSAWLAFLAGEIVLYACGLPWLAVFVGPSKALSLGLFPFLPGDLVKVILAAFALPSLWAVIPTARIRPTTNPTDDQSDQ